MVTSKIKSCLTHIKKQITKLELKAAKLANKMKVIISKSSTISINQKTFRSTNSTSEWQYINKKSIKTIKIESIIETIKIETTAISWKNKKGSLNRTGDAIFV